jgi:hypothetical protein
VARPRDGDLRDPGHEETGEELVTDELRVDDGSLQFDFSGSCGYQARFDHAG